MNIVEVINKCVGLCFAAVLTAFLGYRAWVWRNDLAKEAGLRLQHRIQQASDQTQFELQMNAPKWPDMKFSAEDMQRAAGVWTPQPGHKP